MAYYCLNTPPYRVHVSGRYCIHASKSLYRIIGLDCYLAIRKLVHLTGYKDSGSKQILLEKLDPTGTDQISQPKDILGCKFKSHSAMKEVWSFRKDYKKDGPVSELDRHLKEPFEMSIALGARPYVNLLHTACTSICHLIYVWNIIDCDVKIFNLVCIFIFMVNI